MPNKDIIVVGGSGGGLDAVRTILAGLPKDLDATVFLVLHTSPQSPGLLAEILDRAGLLPVVYASDGERFERGRVYVAPTDRHLTVEPGVLRVTRGPKENRFRPAVDPLFRSAAQVYGPRAVGVILTGGLDDGAAGLWALKRLGGTVVVQDPSDALYASMPEHALRRVEADYRVPVVEIAQILVGLTKTSADDMGGVPVSDDLEIEIKIAKGEEPIGAGVRTLGPPSSYACPSCHGVLIRVAEGGVLRFRCHTGHAYSAESLMSAIEEAVDEALWNAVRSVDEGVMFMRELAQHLADRHSDDAAEDFMRRADAAARRAETVRRLAVGQEPALALPDSNAS